MNIERWSRMRLMLQILECGTEIDRAVRGKKEADRIYITKVKANPEIVLEEVFPMSHLQFALQCLELTIRNPKNINRGKELLELKRQKEILLDYFDENINNSTYESIMEYWNSIVYQWDGKKRHFYITGDCHGDFKKIDFFCQYHDTGKDDVMIILGDAGINYWLDKTDQKVKKHLSGLPISFLMVHGNHEAWASGIESYKERKWRGGTVYYEEEFPDILFAKDGEIYNFDGKKGIVIGGAYSMDKDYRLSAGLPWFESEQPSAEIKSYVEEQLQARDWTVDYVLSHTCPLFMEPTDLLLDDIDWSKVDKTTEEWLEQIHKKLKYQKWYFGHFHENRYYATMEILYEEIKELGSNDFLQRVGRPKYRRGECVMFSYGSDDIYGWIAVVDAYGTFGQPREVSYDIEGIDGTQCDKTLYKHIPESVVERI